VLTLGRRREDYADYYAEVIDLGAIDLPWIRDGERQHYLWLRQRVRPYAQDWPEFKNCQLRRLLNHPPISRAIRPGLKSVSGSIDNLKVR
jgi:hypothetical protein